MDEPTTVAKKRFKLVPEMEGRMARWYARQRGTESQILAWRKQARELTDGLRDGADVLEVAPGPGYLAVEIARLERFHVTGLDISHTFVEIAAENARVAGVTVRFLQGDVSTMPFDTGSFDLVICQAAFKNFLDPAAALREMHRVLRPGGRAVIHDLRKDASTPEIEQEVSGMQIGVVNAFITKLILSTMLRRRAYTSAQFRQLLADSPFRGAEMRQDGIGVEIRAEKRATERAA